MSIHQRGPDQSDFAISMAQALHDDPACAALLLDSEDRITSHTPTAAALLGCPGLKMAGITIDQLPAMVRHLIELAPDGTPTSNPNSRLRVRVYPLTAPAGPSQRLVLIQDCSQIHRLEADTRQLERLASVGTLAAEMAHEVKNALVAVKTFSDLLTEKNQDVELADTVRREVRRIEAIVSQVLKFSRPSATGNQPTRLHPLLDRCLHGLKPHLTSRRLTLVTRFGAQSDLIHGDEPHLEQAIINLILNAAEAVTGDGTITVETDNETDPASPSGKRPIRVTIRDTGPGIAAEDMARLFEPFFSTKPQGTGLGLAITRRIIHEHHGVIRAESEPGKGTAFHILLPAL